MDAGFKHCIKCKQDRIAEIKALARRIFDSKHKGKSVVYFLRDLQSGCIKIGNTTDLRSRLGKLDCGSPTPHELLIWVHGDRATEMSLHRLFAYARVRHEWYQPDAGLLFLIAELRKRKGLKEYLSARNAFEQLDT